MGNFRTLFRTFFRRGKYNLTKIISLSVGLALGLVLIAQVYFEQSYNNFFPDRERIYQVFANYSTTEGFKVYPQTPGGVAVGMKAELPEVEVATRLTWLAYDAIMVTPDKKKYSGKIVLGDSCLFDVFPRPVLAGDVKDVLSRPMYVMVSRKIAEKMGGVGEAVGQTFIIDSRPGKPLTVGGVFEDIPNNSHLSYDVVVSMPSIGQFMYDGTLNWLGNDRYVSYVKLFPGTAPDGLGPGLEKMKEKYLPLEDLKKSGTDVGWSFKPLAEIHVGDEETKRMTLILSLLAAALLFTAVMNYILIVISSLVNRSREMAVNKCYGASERDIYSRMFSETLVDLLISAGIASLLIFFFRGTILSLLGTTVNDLFTFKSILLLAGICLLVFVVAALIPGYLYARVPVAVAFRKFTESKRYWKLGLLFIQFIAAGLFVTLLIIIGRQYNFMLNYNPGYEYEDLAYCNLSGVDTELRRKALDEVLRLADVSEATTGTQLLFGYPSGNNILLPDDDRELFNIADLYQVGNGYLKMMGIPVVEGRSFIENTPSSKEVMVSRSFIEKIMKFTDWPDGVVGKEIVITEHSRSASDIYTICGVYEDIRLGIIGRTDTRASVMFYGENPSHLLMIRFHKQTPELIQQVSDMLTELLPDKNIVVNSYAAELKSQYGDAERFRNSVVVGGIVTLIICLIGLIGYTNDEISRRRKETAIRKVNGATTRDILHLFVKNISWMAVPAITLGCMSAYFIARSWLKKFPDKAELTVLLFIGCGIAVLLIVLVAVLVNCYRAANENPAENVKTE